MLTGSKNKKIKKINKRERKNIGMVTWELEKRNVRSIMFSQYFYSKL